MSASINLRHIITNRTKSVGFDFLEKLLNHTMNQGELQSDIKYKFKENYLKIEYFAKCIPSFIYNNPILKVEDIVTIYSSDLGDKDSFLIFDSTWNGNFVFEHCFYEFDQIKVAGKPKEIVMFQEYLYESKVIISPTDKWINKSRGKLVLQTLNSNLSFSNQYQSYSLVEETEKEELLIENESCWPSTIWIEDNILNKKLERIIHEMFHNPEYYDNDICKVEFKNQGQTIFLANFDKLKREWMFFQHNDLCRIMSNKRFRMKMEEITYR